MASPVSFGDAYTMARLAFRLGKAFTKGRRSAPAEFREVESQLYALSTALESMKQAVDRGEIRPELDTVAEGEDPIAAMLASCNATLAHLDDIVKKYGTISELGDDGGKEPILKRVGKQMKTNWRKILWTTEGGDLATLRSQLTLHTNSLGLVSGLQTNATVSKSSVILQEIYEWFVASLRNSTVGIATTDVEAAPPSENVHFELRADHFLCRRAAFNNPDQSIKRSTRSGEQAELFQCCCSHERTGDTRSHVDQVSALTLSPQSFPIRLSENPRSWLLYKAKNRHTHQLQSIKIRCISLKHMAQFEEQFVERLAVWRARDLLQQEMSTIMAHPSPRGDEVRILNILGDTSSVQSIDSVTYSSSAKSFTKDAIESVQLVHYKSLPATAVADLSFKSACQESYDNKAELIIFYKTDGKDNRELSRTVIYLEFGTVVESPVTEQTRSSLTLGPVKCTGFYSGDEPESSADGVRLILSFSEPGGAEKLHLKLLEMRVELLVISHQYPRPDESVCLQLLADEVSCDDLHIENAVINIVVSEIDNRYRLIIRSQNGCTVLTQKLNNESMRSWSPGTRPNFHARTYEIQMQERDGAVYRNIRQRDGLPNLCVSVSATQNDQLLNLGIGALTMN